MTTEAPGVPSAPPVEPESTVAVPEGNGGAPPASVPAATAPVPAEQKSEEKEPKVLDLTSLAPTRRLVKLPTEEHPEGETFEMRLLDDFGIADQQRLLKWSRTYEKLFNSEDDLEDEEQVAADARLKFVLDSLFDKVLDAPKAVKAAMPDGVRSRVMTAFSLAPLIAQQERAQRELEKKQAEEKAEQGEEDENSKSGTSES